MHIDELLNRLVEKKGSDLHLKSGREPVCRVDGEMCALNEDAARLDDQALDEIFCQVVPERLRQAAADLRELDLSYQPKGGAVRFRSSRSIPMRP